MVEVPDGEDMTPVYVEVPESWVKRFEQTYSHGSKSDTVREAFYYATHAGDSRRERLRSELDALDDEIDAAKRELRETTATIQARIDELEAKRRRVEKRLEKTDNAESEYDGHIESIVALVEDGKRVFDDHPAVRKAATKGGVTYDDVYDDVREAADIEIPDEAFRPAKPHEETNWRGKRP